MVFIIMHVLFLDINMLCVSYINYMKYNNSSSVNVSAISNSIFYEQSSMDF